jgi:nitrile hydratase
MPSGLLPEYQKCQLNCGSVPTKIPAAIEVGGVYFSHLSLNSKTEFLVNMKADTRDLPREHQDVHGHHAVPSELALRVKALESLLVEKGLVDPAALDALIDTYEHKIGPRNGARVVARAWVDPAYKERLLTDATAAIAELGYTGGQGEHMIVVANGPKVHNLVVCTLCSCYPWPVLGLPPVWYKSAPYRSRAVIDPRGVLGEFGLELPKDVEIRVWDSTSEVRYLVLPERPAGSEKLNEEELTVLVTRDAMVGVAKVEMPRAGANL